MAVERLDRGLWYQRRPFRVDGPQFTRGDVQLGLDGKIPAYLRDLLGAFCDSFGSPTKPRISSQRC
jgi:hypothetical protein